MQGALGLGLKRGGSVGRLSRHNSITGGTEAGKPLARGGSLVIDLEAQAVASPQPGSAPATISALAARHMVAGALQSVPSNGALLSSFLTPLMGKKFASNAGRPAIVLLVKISYSLQNDR